MDNLSILIKTKLDTSEITQEKLNKLFKNLKINLKAKLDLSDESLIRFNKDIEKLINKVKLNVKARLDLSDESITKFNKDIEKLSKATKLNLSIGIDKKSFSNAEKTTEDVVDKVAKKTKENSKIKLFNKEELEKEGREFFVSATGIVDKVKKKYNSLGDVNVNFLKNEKEQIIGFITEIKKLDGTIEKLKFDMAKIQVGKSMQKGFVFTGANLIDKNAGDNIQSALNKLQTFENRLNKIRDSFTSMRGVKDETNLNILLREYDSILGKIEKIKLSQSKLSEEQKRSIDKHINALDSLSKKYREIEVTAEKGFNFKQYNEVSSGMNKITSANEAYNTSLLEGHRLVRANVQETQQYLKITQQLQKGNWLKDIGVYVDKATGKMYQFQKAQHNTMIDTITWEKALVTAMKRINVSPLYQ